MKKRAKKESCCTNEPCCSNHHSRSMCGGCGGIYGLGFIGAAVYYISQATGFWANILAILKAAVWPALLIYDALKFLGM